MPDLDEPVGKDVQQEPPDELVGIQGHDLRRVVVRVIPPPERDLVVFNLDQPVGVSAEIVDNGLGLLKRRFAVRDLLHLIGHRGI